MRTTTAVALSSVVLAGLLTASCRNVERRELIASKNTVTKRGVVSCWADWVKDKGDKFDISFSIRNESDQALIVFLHDIVAGRGKAEGPVRYGNFGIGERTIDFHPGQTKEQTFVCDAVDVAKSGPYHVTIKRVYSNPNHDGRSYGEVLAEDVEWESE
jgi:hypothetical protein